MSLYAPPKDLMAEVFTTVPEEYRYRNRAAPWTDANKPGQTVDCFFEGPSFDRDGNLYVTDIPFGRVFRVSPDGVWSLIAEYDGWPNGLKIHRDGRIFIADYKHGIMQLDPETGAVSPFLTHWNSEGFIGINDLFFDQLGRMYFTDQGQTGMHDPTGRVYRYDMEADRLEKLIANAPSPNGLVTNPEEDVLYVAMTRGNAIWRVPLMPNGSIAKTSIFTPMAGGVGGADGLAMDSDGNLFACDVGNGCVWVFSKWGEPVYRIKACTAGRATTNLAFGGPDNRHLFIIESATGTILRIEMDVPGRRMYAHA